MNEVLFNLYAITTSPTISRRHDSSTTGRGPRPPPPAKTTWAETTRILIFLRSSATRAATRRPRTPPTRASWVEFFAAVTRNHSWATGGSNDGEHWGAPMRMGDQLNGNTEESCTQYNILKVARHSFLWSANASLADFNSAILNGMLGQPRPHKPFDDVVHLHAAPRQQRHGQAVGTVRPQLPMLPGGTLSEQLSKMGDSIYFKAAATAAGQPPVLYVNLFVSSVLSFSTPAWQSCSRAASRPTQTSPPRSPSRRSSLRPRKRSTRRDRLERRRRHRPRSNCARPPGRPQGRTQ